MHPDRQVSTAWRRTASVLLAALLIMLPAGLSRAQPAAPAAPPATAGLQQSYLPLVVGPAAPAGAPVIDSFQLSLGAGPMGAENELRWKVRGATRLSIEPGIGDVSGGASVVVYPIATTTYTLFASNQSGSVTATVTYTADAPPVPDPLTIAAQPDAARAVSMPIGPAGGAITATGADGTRYTLDIPPEALHYPEAITLTPAGAITGLPFPASALYAVSIAPEGLLFIEPATLTITPAGASSGARALGFGFQGTGNEFHLRTLLPGAEAPGLHQAGPAAQLGVTIARSYGAAETFADDDLLAPLVPRAPSDPIEAADHVYNAALDEAQSQTLRRLLRTQQLSDLYQRAVRVLLTLTASNPESQLAPLDLVVQRYIDWRRQLREAGLEDLFRAEISQANLLLGEALHKAGELATARCDDKLPAQGFALQRYIAYAKKFGLVNTRAQLEERLQACWTFKLTFQSKISERVGSTIGVYELKATLELRFENGRMIGSGPLNWEQFIFDNDDPDCQIVTDPEGSTFDAASGDFGLWVAPVGRMSPDVSVRLSYDPGQPIGHFTVLCPNDPPVSGASPAWWAYYGQMHAHERQVAGFTAQEPAARFSQFAGWVYDHTLPANSITEHTEIRLEHTPAHR